MNLLIYVSMMRPAKLEIIIAARTGVHPTRRTRFTYWIFSKLLQQFSQNIRELTLLFVTNQIQKGKDTNSKMIIINETGVPGIKYLHS